MTDRDADRRWEFRFGAPHLRTVRPTAGDPATAPAAVGDGEGAYGVIYDGARGEWSPRLPFPVGYDSVPGVDPHATDVDRAVLEAIE
jgi:hypothetical protein